MIFSQLGWVGDFGFQLFARVSVSWTWRWASVTVGVSWNVR